MAMEVLVHLRMSALDLRTDRGLRSEDLVQSLTQCLDLIQHFNVLLKVCVP